ncbi:Putative 115 kDa protein in type-1 retrotransposable element R1DM [Eumeta japonica]|uniref:115 kDa protein in type-1 retrotransposable element R1DM n=1 Tax=Eumeta variegata TaxID=151549 RepID=A0A4C1ZRD2_EUMVA|nr:Putative 115 kDa protein in type-1 retrotransposable element R1DM [Eumeta japonica]
MRSPSKTGWYGSIEGSVLLAAGALAAVERTYTAEGSSTEGCTDRVSLRFIQSKLQRSKLATTELLVEAERRKIAVALVQEPYIGNIGELRCYPGCRVVQKTTPRRGPDKAAIINLNSDVDVEEDQTLNGENVAAAIIKAGNCRIGIVSMYFEGDMPIGPYLDRVRYVCSKLGTEKIILGAMLTRGAWWGSGRQAGDGKNLWYGIYRVIRETGKNREDVLLKTDSEKVLGPEESATLLVETFFPDDRIDADDPYHTEVRRRTDEGSQPPETSRDLPGVEPPFSGAEIRSDFKAFRRRKSRGIDGFTSDICQAAIFRDLGLFLSMANKCLELGYFPRASKVAAIKVIPKPG